MECHSHHMFAYCTKMLIWQSSALSFHRTWKKTAGITGHDIIVFQLQLVSPSPVPTYQIFLCSLMPVRYGDAGQISATVAVFNNCLQFLIHWCFQDYFMISFHIFTNFLMILYHPFWFFMIIFKFYDLNKFPSKIKSNGNLETGYNRYQ